MLCYYDKHVRISSKRSKQKLYITKIVVSEVVYEDIVTSFICCGALIL